MRIYSINQLKASFVSKGYGAFWEKAKDSDAVCMYVRLIQETKTGDWQTINVQDTARYLGVSAPSNCPNSVAEANKKAKENAESILHKLFGETSVPTQDVQLASVGVYGEASAGTAILLLLVSLTLIKAGRNVQKRISRR